MTASNVAANLADVQARIERAALAAGRDPSSVKLVAVSKTHAADAVRQAYAAGQRAFGESYAQELTRKAEALKDLAEIEWHFIGHLQSNKARLVVRPAHVVQTIDSTGLARELGKRAAGSDAASVGRGLRVLVEVSLGGEAQKAGVAPADLEDLLRAVEAQPSLRLRGLMTVPPAGDLAAARGVFETLGLLRNLHGGVARLSELSMGMSDDLEIAIACGATIVRAGTAIFGPRSL